MDELPRPQVDSAGDSSIQSIEELDWHRPRRHKKNVDYSGGKIYLPGGNVNVPVLSQIAEGLEIGQGAFDGDVHRRRAAGSSGAGSLLRHGCFGLSKVYKGNMQRATKQTLTVGLEYAGIFRRISA